MKLNQVDAVDPGRDARLGRIVNQSLTDKLGAYTFKGLDPGNYIVEIVSNNQTTLAATNLISANAGETVTAVVRLPFKPSLLAAILGQQSTVSSAAKDVGSISSSSTSNFGGVLTSLVEQLPATTGQAIPTLLPSGPPVTEQ